MKNVKKLGLILLIGMLLMAFVPAVDAVASLHSPSLGIEWVDSTTVKLTYNVTAANSTHIRYMAPPPNVALNFGIADGTLVVNTTNTIGQTTYTLTGLTADTTYYFQAWSQFYVGRNHTTTANFGTNSSLNIHMPPTGASGGGHDYSGLDETGSAPPATITPTGLDTIYEENTVVIWAGGIILLIAAAWKFGWLAFLL